MLILQIEMEENFPPVMGNVPKDSNSDVHAGSPGRHAVRHLYCVTVQSAS